MAFRILIDLFADTDIIYEPSRQMQGGQTVKSGKKSYYFRQQVYRTIL